MNRWMPMGKSAFGVEVALPGELGVAIHQGMRCCRGLLDLGLVCLQGFGSICGFFALCGLVRCRCQLPSRGSRVGLSQFSGGFGSLFCLVNVSIASPRTFDHLTMIHQDESI